MTSLLQFLILNRAGTRVGRATYIYLALWAIFMIALHLLVNTTKVMPISVAMPLLYGFLIVSPPILLLNRLDRSGPSLEEARIAAIAEEVARERNWAYRLGRWVGRKSKK